MNSHIQNISSVDIHNDDLDDEIINWFRETVNAQNGGNYQTLINQALQDYIQQKGESLESLLRRILREELTTSK